MLFHFYSDSINPVALQHDIIIPLLDVMDKVPIKSLRKGIIKRNCYEILKFGKRTKTLPEIQRQSKKSTATYN